MSRWINGNVVPDAELVVALARKYAVSPVSALVAAGYLEPDDITNPGVQPRALSLHEFSERELAVEILRRADQGSAELDQPLDGDHPAMQEYLSPDVGAESDDDPLANVTKLLSRRESKELPPAKAAKRRQRKKDDQDDD